MAKEDRGFASMDRSKQREIASKGGKAAHQKGTAHEWTSEEAREAGRKGGMASHRRKQEQQGGESGGGETGNENPPRHRRAGLGVRHSRSVVALSTGQACLPAPLSTAYNRKFLPSRTPDRYWEVVQR